MCKSHALAPESECPRPRQKPEEINSGAILVSHSNPGRKRVFSTGGSLC